LENTITELKSVSGNNKLVLGLFRTNLQIDNESFPAEFYVIKNMKRDLIIGCDFMVRHGTYVHIVVIKSNVWDFGM
jgi:hypothetical protein